MFLSVRFPTNNFRICLILNLAMNSHREETSSYASAVSPLSEANRMVFDRITNWNAQWRTRGVHSCTCKTVTKANWNRALYTDQLRLQTWTLDKHFFVNLIGRIPCCSPLPYKADGAISRRWPTDRCCFYSTCPPKNKRHPPSSHQASVTQLIQTQIHQWRATQQWRQTKFMMFIYCISLETTSTFPTRLCSSILPSLRRVSGFYIDSKAL